MAVLAAIGKTDGGFAAYIKKLLGARNGLNLMLLKIIECSVGTFIKKVCKAYEKSKSVGPVINAFGADSVISKG